MNEGINDGCGDCKPYQFSPVPFDVDQHLEFLDFSEDGFLLLGSSNLVMQNWTGSFWYFNNADLAPHKGNCITGHSCESAVSCGSFLENKEKVIIGEDSGIVSVYSVTTFENNAVDIVFQMSSACHDSWVSSLSVTPSKIQTITGGDDKRINVLDNESMTTIHDYAQAHTRAVTCVQTGKANDLFISTSLDKSVLLWDQRHNRPASAIIENHEFGLTSASWKNGNEIAIGSQSGSVSLIDLRTYRILHDVDFQKNSIHRIVFDNNGLLAVCSDSCTVTVWDSEANKILYSDERHQGFVRGLAWHPISNKLYSCGFDKQVLAHN